MMIASFSVMSWCYYINYEFLLFLFFDSKFEMPTTRGANKQKKAKVEDVFTFGKYVLNFPNLLDHLISK